VLLLIGRVFVFGRKGEDEVNASDAIIEEQVPPLKEKHC
jgi:hypothetical protein